MPPAWAFTVIVTPPALEVMVLAPWLKPLPVPFATALTVTPVVPAKVPADNAPPKVIAAPFTAAVVGVAAVTQPKHVLSNRM